MIIVGIEVKEVVEKEKATEIVKEDIKIQSKKL